MSWEGLSTAIRSRLTGDTGSGGLFDGANPLVTGVYAMRAPFDATFPYIVIEFVSGTPIHAFDSAKKHDRYEVQVTAYTSDESGMERAQLIYDRILARLDRWQPTVSGLTCSQLIRRLGQPPERVEDAVQTLASFEVHTSSG